MLSLTFYGITLGLKERWEGMPEKMQNVANNLSSPLSTSSHASSTQTLLHACKIREIQQQQQQQKNEKESLGEND